MSRSFLAPLLLALAVTGGVARAAPQAARIPVQVVADKLVVRCDISTRFRRIPVNLFVDYEAACGLELHNQAGSGIRSENEDGSANQITIHLPGMEMVVPRREIGDDPYLDHFTKWYSTELSDVACVGVIGAKLLRDYHAVLDLGAGWIELSAPRTRSERTPAERPGSFTVPITVQSDVCWLPVTYGSGEAGVMGVATSRFDSVIDPWIADELDAPAGDIGPVLLGGSTDLGSYVALRPEEIRWQHTDGVLAMSGIGLLQHFRVELDRVNRYARISPRRAASYPEGDLECFRAMVDEDSGRLGAFIEANPDSRLAYEASQVLLDLLMFEGAGEEQVRLALEAADAVCIDDLRATAALETMQRITLFGEPAYAVLAAEIGIAGGRDDRYPNAVHELHAELGEVQLERGEDREAWRHLLSAAFGLPEDGMINLNLGRYYERAGRYRRAFSRYVQASIQPDSGPQALEALARVQPMLPEEEPFSVELIERMISGKVRSFGAATVYEPDEEHPAERAVLVEFFTNAHLGDEVAGAIGGALGNEGLLAHFAGEHVAFLSYHLPSPKPDPLVNALAEATARELGVGRPMEHRIDGTRQGPGAARWRQAEGVYEANRGQILSALKQPSDFELELEARVEDGVVSGVLHVHGPPVSGVRVHLTLAEAGVLYPGESTVVVHRQVARAPMLGQRGVRWEPTGAGMEIPFERSLDEIKAENEAYLDELQAAGLGPVEKFGTAIDPGQVRLVAYLRNPFTGETLGALAHTPELPGDEVDQ